MTVFAPYGMFEAWFRLFLGSKMDQSHAKKPNEVIEVRQRGR